ncbi:MAG: glycogen phosphorylase [Bacteroidetes bacterium]|nr:MAG: glycogen phosphorylase [Bacteroidota bacterium]
MPSESNISDTEKNITVFEGSHPLLVNEPTSVERDILESLYYVKGKTTDLATVHDWYWAVAFTVRCRLMKNWIETLHHLTEKKGKIVGYLSAEFLIGPSLGNALINMGAYNEFEEATRKLGLDLRQLIDKEEEPGLGNGGLGRLAACFMDSLTTLRVPAIGYGIRYEYGLFDQHIRDGWQVEVTDKWLKYGNPWEIERPELTFSVKLGGHTESHTDKNGNYIVKWIPNVEVKGVAYDTVIPGFKSSTANILRLWKSEAIESFDFGAFNQGDYFKAVEEKISSENIGKVLYPNDEREQGKRLRLSQQYFFVSCSIQDALRMHEIRGLAIKDFPDSMAFQLNDTHPAIAVAELMRILVDEKGLAWNLAWEITTKTFSYTNHTLLPEALEKWPLRLFGSLLPRHLEIIFEINARFLAEVGMSHPNNEMLWRRLSIIDEEGARYVRMAHLACIGSHTVNGVSALHSELLKKEVMRDFYDLSPGKFTNITNGVTPRRWLRLYNPELSNLISEKIGDGWITKMEDELIALEKFADDTEFQMRWRDVRRNHKNAFVKYLSRKDLADLDPNSIFDIMVKRIHEYKRQHLNVLHIIHLYNQIKRDPGAFMVPRAFVFGGKAAPGYYMAKLIIRLIHGVGEVVNHDRDVDGRLKVVFYPDFSVKSSEWVYRAADLSEQISTAGKEASGTGNMKFALNGALCIGTLDGANIEIRESVGPENFFSFGLTVDDIRDLRQKGYQPYELYQNDPDIKEIIDRIQSGDFSRGDKSLFKPFVDSLLGYDPYFVLQDFRSYADCQQRVSTSFTDILSWTSMSILNVARSGKFSSDRSIREYCKRIWNVKTGR